jgi:hypothetical protein
MNDTEELIAISILSLDLSEPIVGWEASLSERGIELLEDDIGRKAISREDARTLMAESREHEARVLEEQRRRDAERADLKLPAGVPALEEGATPFESMVAGGDYVSVAQEFGRPRPNFLEEELAEGRRVNAQKRRVKDGER